MRDESAFERAEFLGPARRTRRDPHRLALFARHLEPDEVPLVVLPLVGATLVVTDRRLLELRTHLEIDGAWNVREFTGYAIAREIPLESIREATRRTRRLDASETIEDALAVSSSRGSETFVISRGPARVAQDEDVDTLIALLTRRNRSPI